MGVGGIRAQHDVGALLLLPPPLVLIFFFHYFDLVSFLVSSHLRAEVSLTDLENKENGKIGNMVVTRKSRRAAKETELRTY